MTFIELLQEANLSDPGREILYQQYLEWKGLEFLEASFDEEYIERISKRKTQIGRKKKIIIKYNKLKEKRFFKKKLHKKKKKSVINIPILPKRPSPPRRIVAKRPIAPRRIIVLPPPPKCTR